MNTPTEERTPTVTWQWVGRVVASFFLFLGSLVFVTFLDTGSLVWLALSLVGVAGALIYLFGLERSSHPLARWARVVGWSMMAGFSLIPTSLLLGPMFLVLLALPTLFPRSERS